jgi:hypothetical protein
MTFEELLVAYARFKMGSTEKSSGSGGNTLQVHIGRQKMAHNHKLTRTRKT